MVPRPLARARAMRSRTCADVIQSCLAWLATRESTRGNVPQEKFARKLCNCRFSHDVTKIQTTKLLILLIFYFNEV